MNTKGVEDGIEAKHALQSSVSSGAVDPKMRWAEVVRQAVPFIGEPPMTTKSPIHNGGTMELTAEQIGRIEDVRYTLNYGSQGGWGNPAASLDACISVLKEVRKSVKKAEGR